MKIVLMNLVINIPSIICMISAGILAYNQIDVWWWFLVIGALSGNIASEKITESKQNGN